MKDDSAQALREYWRAQSQLSLFPPATIDEIVGFERRYGVVLPGELREVYLVANGFSPPHDQDDNGFSFWPLERVCPVAAFDDGQWASRETVGHFIFADYLGLSWGFACRLTPGAAQTPVCIVGTAEHKPRSIAASFAEFVQLYIRDDERLYATK
jgi:hypothetical protein